MKVEVLCKFESLTIHRTLSPILCFLLLSVAVLLLQRKPFPTRTLNVIARPPIRYDHGYSGDPSSRAPNL